MTGDGDETTQVETKVNGFVNPWGCQHQCGDSPFDMTIMNGAVLAEETPDVPPGELASCGNAKAGQTGEEKPPDRMVSSAGMAGPPRGFVQLLALCGWWRCGGLLG